MCPVFRSDEITEITKSQATGEKADAMNEIERQEDVLDVLGPTISISRSCPNLTMTFVS
jgi:hypothetical protein